MKITTFIVAITGVMLAGCGVTYPITVIDDTHELLVIRATGKTEYEALKAAKGKATEMLGTYVEKEPADCNYNPGQGNQEIAGGVYENVGSWHECVVYAQKDSARPAE